MDPSVGVCFLSGDEAPEFASHVLNSLRQPLESGTVTIGRTDRMLTFPARFQMIHAALVTPNIASAPSMSTNPAGIAGRSANCAITRSTSAAA